MTGWWVLAPPIAFVVIVAILCLAARRWLRRSYRGVGE